MELDTLIAFGGAIKSLGPAAGGGERIGGYLVEFGTAETHDATPERDFFDAETDFGIENGSKTAVYYHHGLDKKIGKRKLGTGTLELKEAGVWFEAELQKRDAYEENILKMVKAGKLGLSSGTAHHLVERTAVKCSRGVAHHIDHWPLGLDASLTPTPANYRNMAVPLKSLMGDKLGRESITKITDLEAGLLDGLAFSDHSAKVLAANAEFNSRFNSWLGKRSSSRKAGRVFSMENHAWLSSHHRALQSLCDDMKAKLDEHGPGGADDSEDIDSLELRLMQQEMKLNDLLRYVS